MSSTLSRPQLPQKLPATPFYFYDEKIIRDLSEAFLASIDKDPHIVLHYAMKANNNPAILKLLREYGGGVDTVSGEELKLALQCGFQASHIVYSGVGKNEVELKLAIESGIALIIVESSEEFAELCELAKDYPQKKVNIAFRFNPNLSVDTHPHIATGLWEHKFGMAGEEVLAIVGQSLPNNICLRGLSLHLGSQLFEYQIFYDAVEEVLKLAREIKSKFKIAFPVLNVGGGLGVDYTKPYEKPHFVEYGKFLKWSLAKWRELNPELDCTVYSECGRALIAQAGFLVSEVIRVKRNPIKNFAIVDASMTELIRPALYAAYHDIEKVYSTKQAPQEVYDVVGPVCESGDFLGEKRSLPRLEKGDLLWITCAGAYGYVLSSQYNLRALPAEYLLSQGDLKQLHGPIKTWV